jgi:DNA-binding CsgD family transcriptional regulator
MSVSLRHGHGAGRAASWIRSGCLAAVGAAVVWAIAVEFAAAPPAPPLLAFEPVAYALGLAAVVAVALFAPARPVLAACLALGLVAVIHFLGFPGGGAGFALFALAFELGRVGSRRALVAAAAVPVAWVFLLALPPDPVPLSSPALFGPALGMLWTTATGYAFGRIRAGSDAAPAEPSPYPALTDEGLQTLLTRREREVAELVATGLDNATIARRLFISPVTVKSHVAHIMAKTGATTRAQLVAQILSA